MTPKREAEIREWLKVMAAYNHVVGDSAITEAGIIISELLMEIERLQRPACPKCASINVYRPRSGFRYSSRDGLQTDYWRCADCGEGFQA